MKINYFIILLCSFKSTSGAGLAVLVHFVEEGEEKISWQQDQFQ
jgi:hypothetical protein